MIDACITQLKAQGPFRTCNESKEEDDEEARVSVAFRAVPASKMGPIFRFYVDLEGLLTSLGRVD